MTYITYSVQHSQVKGFTLNIEERSKFRDTLEVWADALCEKTGHRMCNSLYIAVSDWAYKKNNILASISIDRKTADLISHKEDKWSWLDSED